MAKVAKKKVAKKVTKKAGTVILTVGQAKQLQAYIAKKGKVFKFLDTKIAKA